MTESNSNKVLVTDLREGDRCDFTEQVSKYGVAPAAGLGFGVPAVGDPANAVVQAALLRLGHDQVVIVSAEVSLLLPATEMITRLASAPSGV